MGVGKTSLISQYVKKIFPESPLPTIAIEFTTKILQINSGGPFIKMQIWDTTGQEKYKSITSHHYRKAVGALLVYDVTRHQSFENCVKWLYELKNFTDKDCVICLIGNKIDLVEHKIKSREVTKEEGENFAKKNQVMFFEVSAKKYGGISNCFKQMTRKIYDLKKDFFKVSSIASESFVVKDTVIQGEENTSYSCC